MDADSALMDAMKPVYVLALTLKEQTHRQEHAFKAAHYRRLACKYNRLTQVLHDYILHRLVKWFASHQAEPDSALMEVRVAAANDPGDAFVFSGDLLKSLNIAILTACVATHDVDDYVTGKLLHRLLCKVEKWRDRFEAELAVIADVGDKLYLQKMK